MRKFVSALCAIAMAAAMIAMPTASAGVFTAKDLADEEGKFAAYSVKNGMRAAFMAFFAEKSWLLRPEPVDAQAWVSGRPDPKIVLDWKSLRAVLSASGDLGMSTGPTIVRSKTEPNSPASHGQFFSIWQKQKNGEWKVLIDHGTSNEPTDTPDSLSNAPLIALDLATPKPGAGTSTEDAEKQFVTRSGNIAAAYSDVITPRTRLLRDGKFPIDGTVAIGEYMKSQEGQWSWTVKMQGSSAANDLAYAVGTFTWQPKGGPARKGPYVRAWIRDTSGPVPARWTLAAEVLTLEPLPKS